MESITQLFAPALRAACFFKERARLIRAKASADVLAVAILEGLRNERDDAMRMAYAHLAMFMKSRNWKESRSELEEHFEEADRAILYGPHAGDVHDRVKAIVAGQLEEYYEQFIDEQNKKRKDLRTVMEGDPYLKVEARIGDMIDARLTVSMEILKERIVDELKKHMGEGEDWKT